MVGNALGFRTVIVIPDTQSQEKKDALRLLGAELIEVPAVPYKDPNNYVKLSGRLAEQLAKTEPNGAIWANQFDNVANRQAHIEATGPEIWDQTDGRVDGFTCAVGTGGTLAGVAIALKERNPKIRIAAADPMGAAIYSWIKTGELQVEGSSITEGIGQGRVTANLEGAPIDDAYQIPDEEALPIIFDLLEHEGLCMGGSTGINIAGAIRMAKDLGPGHTIVTDPCATTARAIRASCSIRNSCSRKDLPVPRWLAQPREPISVPFRDEARITARLHRMACRAPRRAGCAHRRCVLVSAASGPRREARICRRAYSARRVLRHRRSVGRDNRPAPHAGAGARNSPAACASSASATAI